MSILPKILRQIQKGRALLYHGTTKEALPSILAKGLRQPSPKEILAPIYAQAGISWETRKRIPKRVRAFIEQELRHRIATSDYGMGRVFFSSPGIAGRFAGQGGEIAHETAMRLNMWMRARASGVRTAKEFDTWMRTANNDRRLYRPLGTPAIVPAVVRLDSRNQRKLETQLGQLIKLVRDGTIEERDAIRAINTDYWEVGVLPQDIRRLIRSGITEGRPD